MPPSASTVNRFLRFLFFGGINTAFGYTAYGLLLFVHVPIGLSLLVATVLGVLFNFITTGTFVFGSTQLSSLPRFTLAYGISWLVGWGLIKLVAASSPEIWVDAWLPHQLLAILPDDQFFRNGFYSALLLMPITAVFNFWLLNTFVFGHKQSRAAESSPQ